MIICKLLNEDGNAIAEGDIPLTVSEVDDTVAYSASETLIININQPISDDATHFDNFFDGKSHYYNIRYRNFICKDFWPYVPRVRDAGGSTMIISAGSPSSMGLRICRL